MKTIIRYSLFQIPAIVLIGMVLIFLYNHHWISPWAGLIIFGAWLLKDILLYPVMRKAYKLDTKTGTELLIGLEGVAVQDLDPAGYIQVQGELWHAISNSNSPIPEKVPIRITAAKNLTLYVERLDEIKL